MRHSASLGSNYCSIRSIIVVILLVRRYSLNLHVEFHVEDSTDHSDIEDNLNPTPASRLGNSGVSRGGGGGLRGPLHLRMNTIKE